MKNFVLLLMVFLSILPKVNAQDTLATPQVDSMKLLSMDSLASIDSLAKENRFVTDYFIKDLQERNNPKRAGLYSALLPGLGQTYNKQYWKIPIVYAAIGTGVGFSIYNYKKYNNFRKEIAVRQSTRGIPNSDLAHYNLIQLQRGMDSYRQDFDLSVLLTGVAYLLQIMDAIAANHLKGFDISPDISLKIKSAPMNEIQPSLGLGVAFQLKK